MTLTDIISKVTRYAKNIIVNDNSPTSAVNITQTGTGKALSITGNLGTGASIATASGTGASITTNSGTGASITTASGNGASITTNTGIGATIKTTSGAGADITTISGTGASITTTTGTPLKVYKNDPTPGFDGSVEFFNGVADFAFDGGGDGRFVFANNSTTFSKYTVFSGAFVGIGEATPQSVLHVGGPTTIGRRDTVQNGGEIRLNRSIDNTPYWYIDALGSGSTPLFRIYDGTTGTIRLIIDGSNGNLGIGTVIPQARLHVVGSVRIQGIPFYANNAAALAGGLTSEDVYKTGTGELRIVV
jgi:hypothetical protein